MSQRVQNGACPIRERTRLAKNHQRHNVQTQSEPARHLNSSVSSVIIFESIPAKQWYWYCTKDIGKTFDSMERNLLSIKLAQICLFLVFLMFGSMTDR